MTSASRATREPLDQGERIRMYLVAGGISLVYLLNWLLP